MLITPWALERSACRAELGAAWGRRIPIVALLLGLSAKELHERPGVPSLAESKKSRTPERHRPHLEELRARVRAHGADT